MHLDSLPKTPAKFLPAMLATSIGSLPDDPLHWIYEAKFDGYRCLALKEKGSATLYSRRGNVLDGHFTAISDDLAEITGGTLIDGELVAFDKEGRPSFNALQHYRSGTPVHYYAFDLLIYQGRNLLRVPVEERRGLLASILPESGAVSFSEGFKARVPQLLESARAVGLEGIVAKRRGSIYQPGIRSHDWLKYRINKGQELVVGGYVPGSAGVDSLLVGYYDDGQRLIFVAKVRNGFVPRTRAEIYKAVRPLETKTCPFVNLPEKKGRLYALTAEEMKNCRWIKPELVAQMEFADWTRDNHLRHSKFVAPAV